MDVLSSRLLHRTGTVAALATAFVLGGSGLALAATTHDVNGPSVPAVPVVVTSVPVAVPHKLAPAPQPQIAPVIRGVTEQVTTTVTGAVRAITAPSKPPAAPAQPPAKSSKPKPVVQTRAPVQAAPKTVAQKTSGVATREVAASPAEDAAFVQRTTPAVVPNLAPTGPLAGLPDGARHALPTALVVIAAAILAALSAGHLGLWRSRRRLAFR